MNYSELLLEYQIIATSFPWSLSELAELPRRMRKFWVQVAAQKQGIEILYEKAGLL